MKTAMVRVMVKMKNKTMETIWWIVTVSVREKEVLFTFRLTCCKETR